MKKKYLIFCAVFLLAAVIAGLLFFQTNYVVIGGNAYDYLFPLLLTALIYLALVMFFAFLVGKLERRLRNSER